MRPGAPLSPGLTKDDARPGYMVHKKFLRIMTRFAAASGVPQPGPSRVPPPGRHWCRRQAVGGAASRGRQGAPQLLFGQIRRAVASKKTLPIWVGSVTEYAAPPPAAAICSSAGKFPLPPSMTMISSTGLFGL